MHVDRPRVAGKVISPHQVEQLTALKPAAGVPCEQRNQVEVVGPELDAILAISHPVALEVDLELGSADQLGLVGFDLGAAQ